MSETPPSVIRSIKHTTEGVVVNDQYVIENAVTIDEPGMSVIDCQPKMHDASHVEYVFEETPDLYYYKEVILHRHRSDRECEQVDIDDISVPDVALCAVQHLAEKPAVAYQPSKPTGDFGPVPGDTSSTRSSTPTMNNAYRHIRQALLSLGEKEQPIITTLLILDNKGETPVSLDEFYDTYHNVAKYGDYHIMQKSQVGAMLNELHQDGLVWQDKITHVATSPSDYEYKFPFENGLCTELLAKKTSFTPSELMDGI